ncbi:hypothetical protein HYS82_00880 [Candidatus Amesbacteria bacterium]|nr:hypothetical protein [Candidatus Amesbacteria bacterium]
MKKRTKSKIPEFKSLQEEADFWDTHSFTEFKDEVRPVKMRVNLGGPKEEVLAVRLQPQLKVKLARTAEEMGVQTSTLVRMWVVEKLKALAGRQA